jgi:transketolase
MNPSAYDWVMNTTYSRPKDPFEDLRECMRQRIREKLRQMGALILAISKNKYANLFKQETKVHLSKIQRGYKFVSNLKLKTGDIILIKAGSTKFPVQVI